MSFNVKCPYCDALLEVDEQWSGQECECPQCGQKFVVPAPPQETPQPKFRRSIPPAGPPPRQQFHHRHTPQPPEQAYEDADGEFRVYNPVGVLVWSLFCPLLGYWFLKRSYEELDEPKRRRNAAMWFYAAVVISAAAPIVALLGILNGATGFLGAISDLLKSSSFFIWVAALVDSCGFIRLLKREYSSCSVRYRSTWLPCGCLTSVAAVVWLLIVLGVLGTIRTAENKLLIDCHDNLTRTGIALLQYAVDHNGEFPNDSGMMKCPSTREEHVYLGRGLKYGGKGDIPIAMEVPGGHKTRVNILYKDGHVETENLYLKRDSCFETLKDLHPDLAFSEEGRIVLNNAQRADAARRLRSPRR